MASVPTLFSPIALGSLELKTRLFNSPHANSLAEQGTIGDDLIAYQEVHATSGVGVIGDAAQLRTVEEAVLEGFETALEI